MNKWQMSGATITNRTAGCCFDNKGKTHFSIHPSGKRERNQTAQRQRRAQNKMADR
jgi:hypothetical protein